MPYLPPTDSSPTTETAPNKPVHRRTRSANSTFTFSTERGPGAFAPIQGIPRRQRQFEKKTLFQIAPDEDEDATKKSTEDNQVRKRRTSPPPSSDGAAADDNSDSDSPNEPESVVKVVIDASSPPVSDIPFPTSTISESSAERTETSQLPFPTLPPSPQPSSSFRSPKNSISRSGSSPVLLANGKPLKPSLKSSLSSPAIGDYRSNHPRSRSEPTSPGTKNVHFPEQRDNLESVVIFEKTARPRAVSGHADDTETETEGYDSPAIPGTGFPFPPPSDQFGLQLDTTASSPIPARHLAPYANIYAETLVFPSNRPPQLRGSILVKNIAFEKHVALRFTLDNWQTTSEVVCRHVVSLPSLPSPFPQERIVPGAPRVGWDRFQFLVRLEDVERKLADRTIFFAARYTATGVGEWWDNNNGDNYKLLFKHIAPVVKGPSPLRFARPTDETPSPKRMFPSLDLRPKTAPSGSTRPTSALTQGLQRNEVVPPKPPSPPPPVTNAPPAPLPNDAPIGLGSHQRNMSNSSISSSGSSGSLRLSNYASPISPVTNSGQRLSFSAMLGMETPSLLMGPIVGGQPVSLPPTPSADTSSGVSSPTADGSTTPTSPSAIPSRRVDTTDSTYAALVEQWCFHQSPPPGVNGIEPAPSTSPGMSNARDWKPAMFDSAAGYGSGYSYGRHAVASPVVLGP